MEIDESTRGSSGVVCSLVETGNGSIRLILDDVKNESDTRRGPWKHDCLYTWKGYEIEQFANLDLSDKELAEFGFYVLARLIALGEQRGSL